MTLTDSKDPWGPGVRAAVDHAHDELIELLTDVHAPWLALELTCELREPTIEPESSISWPWVISIGALFVLVGVFGWALIEDVTGPCTNMHDAARCRP